MAGYFELKKGNSGKFLFNLKAGNHQVVLTSQGYSSRAAALAGIESVRKNAKAEANFQRKTAKDGSAYFTLVSADNGQVVGRSETYSSTSAAGRGIASVRVNAKGKVVEI